MMLNQYLAGRFGDSFDTDAIAVGVARYICTRIEFDPKLAHVIAPHYSASIIDIAEGLGLDLGQLAEANRR